MITLEAKVDRPRDQINITPSPNCNELQIAPVLQKMSTPHEFYIFLLSRILYRTVHTKRHAVQAMHVSS